MIRRLLVLGVFLLTLAASPARPATASGPDDAPGCRATLAVGIAEAALVAPPSVLWQPAGGDDDGRFAAWCDAVGPAVIAATGAPAVPADRLVVVSWNLHVGGGNLKALLASLGVERTADGTRPPVVLLLQEALRRGEAVPKMRAGARSARRIGHKPPVDARDIVDDARELGLWAAYVPSMRNGAGAPEDRGNAILSTLPLEAVEAIELPAGRQRRVAVAADVAGRRTDGTPWRLRVTSVHLESQTHARRLWLFAGGIRAAQARAVVTAIDRADAAILGGDLNSFAGFDEAAYRETAAHFPDTVVSDGRPTFAFRRRLDHLFFRLPDGWQASFRRLDDRFGSDHYPLAGVVSIDAPARGAEKVAAY
jgi:endonuclease/exonuclease/phosphatase family metal-dependent hydrolase